MQYLRCSGLIFLYNSVSDNCRVWSDAVSYVVLRIRADKVWSWICRVIFIVNHLVHYYISVPNGVPKRSNGIIDHL